MGSGIPGSVTVVKNWKILARYRLNQQCYVGNTRSVKFKLVIKFMLRGGQRSESEVCGLVSRMLTRQFFAELLHIVCWLELVEGLNLMAGSLCDDNVVTVSEDCKAFLLS